MKGEGVAGASESAVRELPQERRKALHQQTHKGERREAESKKGNKNGLLLRCSHERCPAFLLFVKSQIMVKLSFYHESTGTSNSLISSFIHDKKD